jgi:hypothetical protein
MLAFLGTCLLFFVSKPLNLVAGPHHVILWLPFWFLMAGYPAALLWQRLPGHVVRLGCLAALLAALAYSLPSGPRWTNVEKSEWDERARNITSATEWMRTRPEPGSVLAIAYHCFNEFVFYEWLRHLDVPAPPATTPPGVMIWWGYRSRLVGTKGYACVTAADLPSIKTERDLEKPGEGTDPYREPAFQSVASFGSGRYRVDLFRFDFTRMP